MHLAAMESQTPTAPLQDCPAPQCPGQCFQDAKASGDWGRQSERQMNRDPELRPPPQLLCGHIRQKSLPQRDLRINKKCDYSGMKCKVTNQQRNSAECPPHSPPASHQHQNNCVYNCDCQSRLGPPLRAVSSMGAETVSVLFPPWNPRIKHSAGHL